MKMTPIGLSFRFNRIFGLATRETERRAQKPYCGACAGVIGFAGGVVNLCRITSGLMRGTVAKAVARVPRGDGAILGFSHALVAASEAAAAPFAITDGNPIQMLRAIVRPENREIAIKSRNLCGVLDGFIAIKRAHATSEPNRFVVNVDL